MVIATPRVLHSRYLPSLGKGPGSRDAVGGTSGIVAILRRHFPENPAGPCDTSGSWRVLNGFWPVRWIQLPNRRSGNLFRSVVPVNEAHRLGPGDVITERAAHRRGHGF